MDRLEAHAVVIAATNHPELLDRAVWRRFTYRIELDYPSLAERKEMWSTFLGVVPASGRDIAVLADLSSGFSGADIREVALRLRRQEIASAKNLRLHQAFRALFQLAPGVNDSARFILNVSTLSTREAARVLRARDSKLYSFQILARILNVSKATAFRYADQAEKGDG